MNLQNRIWPYKLLQEPHQFDLTDRFNWATHDEYYHGFRGWVKPKSAKVNDMRTAKGR